MHKFSRVLNRIATTTKDENKLCLVLQLAKGIDLVYFLKLLGPKLKYDTDPNVFEHVSDLEFFIQ